LFSSRRVFLKSLSWSALVLPLEGVLRAARPTWVRASIAAGQKVDPKEAPPAIPSDPGVSFLNVARSAGLNVLSDFGG